MNEDEIKASRDEHTSKILSSTASKRIIIAGPGCGKTFTFGKLLPQLGSTPEDSIAITFINTLTNDLKKKLDGKADIRTFHSLAKKLLHGQSQHLELHLGLEDIIKTDYHLLTGNTYPNSFSTAFRTLEEGDDITFYLGRGDYYRAASHDDIVYRVLKLSQASGTKIAKYKTVIIDEFQDFNALEVAFIESVIDAQYLILAGDDDQAIYTTLRHASPKFIRDVRNDTSFEQFVLPYCTRCTEVIVNAVHDVVKKAKDSGITNEQRLEKEFICYFPDKAEDNKNFPKIIYARCSTNTNRSPYIAKYIESEIKKISSEEIKEMKEKENYSVLVIGKSHYLKSISDYFKTQNIPHEIKTKAELLFEDLRFALQLLIRDMTSNLGWRIIMEYKNPTNLPDIITKSEDGTLLHEMLDQDYKNKYEGMVKIYTALSGESEISQEDWDELTDFFSMDKDNIQKRIKKQEEEVESNDLTIKLTSHVGAKGLSAGRVFIVSFNNGEFPQNPNSISEEEVNTFLVALTRTVKQCYLISNKSFGAKLFIKPSVFLGWLDSSSIEAVEINAAYFTSS